jgi:hypothetical protein
MTTDAPTELRVLREALARQFAALGAPTVEARDDDFDAILIGAYGGEDIPSILGRHVFPFLRDYAERVRQLLADYADDPRRPRALTSPECLLIFERLQHDRFALFTHWPPDEDLATFERISAIWGVPGPR